MVVILDDLAFTVLAGILTVGAKCMDRYNTARKNGREYKLLLVDLQRIAAMYMLDPERFSEERREQARHTIVHVGIDISGHHASELGEQIQQWGGEGRLKLESLQIALHEKLNTL
jgi:hypothetical protein